MLDLLETRIPPPLVMLATGGIAWLAMRVLPAFDFALPYRAAFVSTMALAGLVLNVGPKLTFSRAGTTVNPLRPNAATRLVTSGFYRRTRNPMYLGHALLLAAWCLGLQNAASLLAVPAFVLYLTRFQIQPEERVLRARFPTEFPAFCGQVPRWL